MFIAVLAAWTSASPAAEIPDREVSVDDPRPVARAIQVLINEHGLRISYEDPRYVYEGDMRDATSEIARSPPAPGKRILVPTGGRLSISYSLVAGKPSDPSELLQQIVTKHAVSESGGRFRVVQEEESFHVFPMSVRNAAGLWIEQESLLETIISLPEQERTHMRAIEDLCRVLSETAGYKVIVGTIPIKLLMQGSSTLGFDQENAGAALTRILDSTGRRLTWMLLFDPGMKIYALNLVVIRDAKPAGTPAATPPAEPKNQNHQEFPPTIAR